MVVLLLVLLLGGVVVGSSGSGLKSVVYGDCMFHYKVLRIYL